MDQDSNKNEPSSVLRELSTVEVEEASGAMLCYVQLAVGAYLAKEYYEWLKANNKI